MTVRSRNFTRNEFLQDRTLPGFLEPDLYYLMGYMQACRDYTSHALKPKDAYGTMYGISINGGWRDKKVNQAAGGAVNSFHTWRHEPFKGDECIIAAADFICLNEDTRKVYDALAPWVRGEMYYSKYDHIHLAQYQAFEPTWVENKEKNNV